MTADLGSTLNHRDASITFSKAEKSDLILPRKSSVDSISRLLSLDPNSSDEKKPRWADTSVCLLFKIKSIMLVFYDLLHFLAG